MCLTVLIYIRHQQRTLQFLHAIQGKGLEFWVQVEADLDSSLHFNSQGLFPETPITLKAGVK